MKTTETNAEPKVEMTAEMTPLSYELPALAPARRLAARAEAGLYFVAHLVAVALLTALGAVVALAAITVAVLLAPISVALFYGVLRRHDRLVAARCAT